MAVFKKLYYYRTATYSQISKLLSCRSSGYRHFTQQEQNHNAEIRMDGVFRQKACYKAIIKKVEDVSPSIKKLHLQIEQPGFSFKAGQWVDFFVPGLEEIGGYSITSAPFEAEENSTLELAIKYGEFPPTLYVHSTCKEGETVEIKVGGDFYYEHESDSPKDLLLVGGGMGINPMVSILSQYYHLLDKESPEFAPCKSSATAILLYSAKTNEEMIFKNRFEDLKAAHPSLICKYFITQNNEGIPSSAKYGRIEESDIEESIDKLRRNNLLCYVCGPSIMTDEITRILHKLGIDTSLIKYEKWW